MRSSSGTSISDLGRSLPRPASTTAPHRLSALSGGRAGRRRECLRRSNRTMRQFLPPTHLQSPTATAPSERGPGIVAMFGIHSEETEMCLYPCLPLRGRGTAKRWWESPARHDNQKGVTSAGAKATPFLYSYLVRLVRVELTTCRLGGGRSIQLSYNRNKDILAENLRTCKTRHARFDKPIQNMIKSTLYRDKKCF